MITSGATTLRVLVRVNAVPVLMVILVIVAVEIAEYFLDVINFQRAVFSMAALGLLTTALSIFLGFRVNEAYARWWEARILWGGVVNYSRTFARQVITLVRTDVVADNDCHRELIYRHLAYINALRMTLRREDDWDSLREYLSPEELSKLSDKANKANQLMQSQAARIAELRQRNMIDQFDHVMLDRSLTELCCLQGGCERIKNTVFPDRVAFFTQFTAWGMAVMIPICVLEADEQLDFLDLIALPAMMLIFIVTERLGSELKNPFEGRPNDTPMTALCRTIEIDLRQQLGETKVPDPPSPQNGVLM